MTVGELAPSDALIASLPCGIVSFTDDGHIVMANGTLATMLGYTTEQLRGRHVETLLTVAGRIFYQTHFFPLLRMHGKAAEVFLLMRRQDGTELGALCNGVRHERDGATVNDCVLLEVRERRKYEEELLRARRTAEAANAELEARSRALEAANELLEQQARELALQHQQMEEQAAELELQQEELQTANDELLLRSDELERARAVADDANRAKSQFLATMSHELRTPLNAIGGYVQLIEMGVHGPISDGQREALDRITRSQRHLMGLINEVLNLARIESGRVDYAVDEVPIDAVVASVMPMVEPQIAAAQLTFSATVATGVVARADRDKLQQVLINLLTNAVKFTPERGRVALASWSDRANGHVVIRDSDSGIGSRAEQLQRIFEPFVQVDAGPTRRREGTGLGLAISRDLARGMGGDLTAESTPGVGSAFTLTLPSGS